MEENDIELIDILICILQGKYNYNTITPQIEKIKKLVPQEILKKDFNSKFNNIGYGDIYNIINHLNDKYNFNEMINTQSTPQFPTAHTTTTTSSEKLLIRCESLRISIRRSHNLNRLL